MSSSSEPTPVDDILADAANRAAQRKIETITTPDDFRQYSEFDGICDLDLSIRIPVSFYEAAKIYASIIKIPVREFLNGIIIEQLEDLDLNCVKDTFVKKYHLRELSSDKREAMVQAYRKFSMSEERLSDA